MIINGNKIFIRPFFEEDLEKIFRILLESDLNHHTTPFWIPRSFNWIKEKFLIETNDIASRYKLAICLNQKDREIPIGFLDIFNINARNARAELGIAIFKIEDRGKGYGNAALSAIIEWCFNSLNLNRLSAKCFSTNIISKKLFEKQGFLVEGTLEEYFFLNGCYENAVVMGLTKKAWIASEKS